MQASATSNSLDLMLEVKCSRGADASKWSFVYLLDEPIIYLFIYLFYIYAELDKNIDVNTCITICIYFCFQRVAQSYFSNRYKFQMIHFVPQFTYFSKKFRMKMTRCIYIFLKESLEIQRIWNLAKLVSNRAIERRCKLLKGEGKRGRKNVSLARRRIGIEINQTR